MARSSRPSWAKLQGEHGAAFLEWLEQADVRSTLFNRLADDLDSFLTEVLSGPGTGQAFVDALPLVLEKCDEDIYDDDLVAEAYAHVHLLERYRRFWDVLACLLRSRVLPMRDRGIDVLDIGTGPAPALYAVGDFYGALHTFGSNHGLALAIPRPRLDSVEASRGMGHFMHRFSEFRQSRGPFGATFNEFDGLDLATERERRRTALINQVIEEDETSEEYARLYVDETEGLNELYSYALSIFSNFLTQESQVVKQREAIESVFRSPRPGGVIVVVGGTKQQYPRVFDLIGEIALEVGVGRVRDVPEEVPCQYSDSSAIRIKQHYDTIAAVLSENHFNIPQSLSRDLWDPAARLNGPGEFGLRAFRRGQRPGRTRSEKSHSEPPLRGSSRAKEA